MVTGQTVLVTGHRGTIGRALLRTAQHKYSFRGFDVLDGDDILDYDAVLSAVTGCRSVVHLAAIARPIDSRPFDDYLRHNVIGTYHVARAAADTGVRRLILASTVAVHGVESGIPVVPALTPQTPYITQRVSAEDVAATDAELSYAVTKAMAEQVVAWFGFTRRLQTVCLRLGPVDISHMGLSVRLDAVCNSILACLLSEEERWHSVKLVSSVATAPDPLPACMGQGCPNGNQGRLQLRPETS
jgi:nucleoside-diphosphate-sugar epimerase